MYAIAMLLILLVTAMIPFFVCAVAGAIAGWVIGLLKRRQSGASLGGLLGGVVGGVLYWAFKRMVLDSYLNSHYDHILSTEPNEIYGRDWVWATSTPKWIMFGAMLLAGAMAGAFGGMCGSKIANGSSAVPPKPGGNGLVNHAEQV